MVKKKKVTGAHVPSPQPAKRPPALKTASPAKKPATPTEFTGLPGSNIKPTGPGESWRHIMSARAPAFDHSVPAYLLDKNYWFLDWNDAFDELIAAPLHLRRISDHAEDFVKKMANVDEVYDRAKRIFGSGKSPLVDIEPIKLQTEKYGLIEFNKIAVQICSLEARLNAWAVYLNIQSAERSDELWRDLQARLERELTWSRYAISYDKLLLNFPEYHELLDSVIAKVHSCRRCIDLGAGTGNGTIKLLRSRPDREVWAVESNQAMLQQLVSKVGDLEIEMNRSFFNRLHVWKENVLRLTDHRSSMPTGQYDAVIMTNVLYAVEDPQECLNQVYSVLKPGGRMVLTTSHRNTEVDELFAALRKSLEKKGQFDALETNFLDARKQHDRLEGMIHRDTKEDIHQYIENACFEIVDSRDAYVNAVVLVEAVKR